MNYKRMGLAFGAVFLAVMVYEYAVYAVLFRGLHEPHYGSLLIPEAEVNQAGFLVWTLIGSAVVTFFYAYFVRGRCWDVRNGVVFGLCLGIMAAVVPQAFNGLLFRAWPFFPHWAISGFGEHLVVGIVLGLVYRE